MPKIIRVSNEMQSFLSDLGITCSSWQIQQLLAASFGLNTLSPDQHYSEAFFRQVHADYVLLDTVAMERRASALDIPIFPIEDFIRAFNSTAGTICAVASFWDLVDKIYTCVEVSLVTDSHEVSAAKSVTNAWYGHMEIDFEEPTIELAEAERFWNIAISALIQGVPDPSKMCVGNQVRVNATVRFEKVGRRCLANLEVLDVEATVENSEAP